MNKAQFQKYIDHFNNKRYDEVSSYFAPGIVVEYFTNLRDPKAPLRTLHGRQAFIESYKTLHQYVREVLELGFFLTEDNLMAVELYTEFHCIKDNPTFISQPMKNGDVAIMTNWVVYNMENDKMKRIRIAHFRMHDPKLAKY